MLIRVILTSDVILFTILFFIINVVSYKFIDLIMFFSSLATDMVNSLHISHNVDKLASSGDILFSPCGIMDEVV